MTERYRILIHVTMERRDIGSAYVLARILEHLGCDCYVVGTVFFSSRWVRLLNPHAVIVSTVSWVRKAAITYPKSNIFYYSGEGGESFEWSADKYFAEDKALFDNTRKLYLWGKLAKRHILQRLEELGKGGHLYERKSSLDEKCLFVGHPRFDFIRYSPDKNIKSEDGRIRIGLIGWFNTLNSIRKKSTLYFLLNDKKQIISEELKFMTSLLDLYIRIIHELDKSKYRISIRPYPQENIEEYFDTKLVKENDIHIDQSLDFGTWAVRQDIIVGPTSSTLSQVAVAGKPFINLDLIGKRSAISYENSIRDVFIKHVRNHCPADFDELMEMIRNYNKHRIENIDFDEIMDDIYSIRNPKSALGLVATDIVHSLQEKCSKLPYNLPKGIAEGFLSIRYRENRNSYSHFLFKHRKENLKKEFDQIALKIISEMNVITQ